MFDKFFIFSYFSEKTTVFLTKLNDMTDIVFAIKKLLIDIAIGNDINVIFACVVGSRAYGLASPTSDYDVRFVYSRKLHFVSIASYSDTITQKIDERFDCQGYDIKKFLIWLRTANQTCFEVLTSDIVIVDAMGFKASCEDLLYQTNFTGTLIHAYAGMLRSDIKHCERDFESKRYLAMCRSLTMLSSLLTHHAMDNIHRSEAESDGLPRHCVRMYYPRMKLHLPTLVDMVSLPDDVKNAIKHFIELKTTGHADQIVRTQSIDDAIVNVLTQCNDVRGLLSTPALEFYDAILRRYVVF